MSLQSPVANFDSVARHYRWMEYLTFGRALELCRTHFINALADRRNALILGEGDGRFLARLLAANATLQADAVDASTAMLHLLARRARTAASRLCIYHEDVRDFAPDQTYDLIVTHFFLDCLAQSEVDALALRLATHAAPDALWLVSDFSIPNGPMRWPAQALVRLLYLSFRVLAGLRTKTLPDHAAALSAAGFTRAASHRLLAGILTSEIWRYTSTMQLPPQRQKPSYPADPVPDPEPPSPSLPEPDPAVFHRAPGPCHQVPESEVESSLGGLLVCVPISMTNNRATFGKPPR